MSINSPQTPTQLRGSCFRFVSHRQPHARCPTSGNDMLKLLQFSNHVQWIFLLELFYSCSQLDGFSSCFCHPISLICFKMLNRTCFPSGCGGTACVVLLITALCRTHVCLWFTRALGSAVTDGPCAEFSRTTRTQVRSCLKTSAGGSEDVQLPHPGSSRAAFRGRPRQRSSLRADCIR